MKKKKENLAERAREFAMNWWNERLNESERSRVIDKHSRFIMFGNTRTPQSLTDEEIELLNRKEENSLMDKLIRGDRVSGKSTGILQRIRNRNNLN